MKYDENIESSVTDKGSSYFNISDYGRNLLDQLDVTYQCAFTTSPLKQGLYQIFPTRERYYDIMVDHIEEKNVGTINKEELREAIALVKFEDKAGHELNIDNMIQEDGYKSPWENKDATDATTVNNTLDETGYTFFKFIPD